MKAVLPHTAARFARAIIMPNLVPPVTTVARAAAYRARILGALPAGLSFQPLMTLYLTERTEAEEIRRARASGIVHGVKWYPAGATTNSESGVSDIRRADAALAALADTGMPLLVHGEVTDPRIDIFDREAVFIERVLTPLRERFPSLRIVLEHVTTAEGVAFVQEASPGIAATITAHHLLINRNAMFDGGIRPHHYCLPVAKRESHRLALVAAATSGSPKFFLGTDSAPHARNRKEAACGCAGIYTAHGALELYAEAFAAAGALQRLEPFASFFGPDFYGLPRNTEQVTLVAEPWRVVDAYALGAESLVPFRAGADIAWKLVP